jgi:transketolase
LPHQPRTDSQLENVSKGGYVLEEADGGADAMIIASGSEVALASAAAKELSSEGIKVRIVSMPNPGCFMRQDEAYRDSVLPADLKARVAVEAGVTPGWASFVGDHGKVIGVDRFGASAPASELFEHYGLTVSAVSEAVRDSLASNE